MDLAVFYAVTKVVPEKGGKAHLKYRVFLDVLFNQS